mgnify:CR=1 FL=1
MPKAINTIEKNLDDELLTAEEESRFLKLRPNTLEIWRLKGIGPKFYRISGRTVRYRLSDLMEFVEKSVRTSTSDQGGS